MQLKIIITNLVVFLILLAGLEGGAYWVLQKQSSRLAQSGNQIAPQFNFYPTLDPLLGWTIGKKQAEALGLVYVEGYIVYGSEHMDNPQAPRVAVFGGSTSDTVFSQNTWVKTFHQKLQEAWGPTVVLNGAVGGYNSHQELLKVIRDIEFLQPNLIVTYDGANEMQGAQLPEQPLVTTYEYQIFERMIESSRVGFPYLISLVRAMKAPQFSRDMEGQATGPANPGTAHELWLKNITLIRATADLFGARFHGFLQPVLGIGDYRLSEREEKIRTTDAIAQRNPSFYAPAIDSVKARSYLSDLTEALNSMSDVYIDDCHLNPEGDTLMGEKVSEVILKLYPQAPRIRPSAIK
ncbi:MAG: SGNH/GDSL hydrolase family protein [Bdellovibrionaceae bacterium]|nr:SGNH/GDSL hydrolase family protein [Bdellovibrionales bacterium]MCB9085805.1 SGNH/GDSL hydrolase family protein [Pseudobdellovibrionaceae bacterium]